MKGMIGSGNLFANFQKLMESGKFRLSENYIRREELGSGILFVSCFGDFSNR